MSIIHHTSNVTLLRHAAGTLNEGLALVVAAHLEFCAHCRAHLHGFEAMAGALLEREPPAPLPPDALEKVLHRFGAPTAAEAATYTPSMLPGGVPLPRALRPYTLGGWRTLSPGIRYSPIGIGKSPVAVMLVRGAPGAVMPAHGHGETEFTCVLSGYFSDKSGHFGPGDMGEATATFDHQPIIGPESECISLVAIEGRLQMHSVLGRLLSPLLGF